jgi:hypothetical protein
MKNRITMFRTSEEVKKSTVFTNPLITPITVQSLEKDCANKLRGKVAAVCSNELVMLF